MLGQGSYGITYLAETVNSNEATCLVAIKELFIREYSEGKKPRQILEECGYSAEVLGDNRIQGISHMIRKQALSVVGLHEGTFRPGNGVSGCLQDPSVDPVAECRRLRSEIEYLKQEVEFLKKISSIRTSNDCRA